MLRIGIDIGGTFTDFVIFDLENGNIDTFKILSDPINPAKTVLQGLSSLQTSNLETIIHGSTVATNALLERKGACTALITTRGFKDVIQIGRQNRPSLYDWSVMPPLMLIPPERRFEVDERVDHHGNVLTPLDPSHLEEIIALLVENQVESVAVCLLFSFLRPEHEQKITDEVRKHGYFVSASSEILPEYREYERTSTTVVNAYVSPILDRYLSILENSLPNSRLQIMQSNGGMIGLNESRRNGARCILSGPAGGVIGALNIARLIHKGDPGVAPHQLPKLITFDMGGTSTDVSLINGKPGLTTDASVDGCPIHLPVLDIHTIGAGGGSIAFVDAGGSLRVGPQSAGANPGPACYGIGKFPTVTDANLVLGRLLPENFLGGKMHIDLDRANTALQQLGDSLNISGIQAALGVIEVVNAQMERALRVISVERGYDPCDFYLFSFGGSGGLHAIALARNMGIPRVIISKFASTLSSFGMLATNVIKDYVKTVMLPATTDLVAITDLFSPLVSSGILELENEGVFSDQVEIEQSLDMRYKGQSYELNIPYSVDFISAYHNAHDTEYGYSYPDKPIEIVNLRVRAIGKVPQISLPPMNETVNESIPEAIKHTSIEFSYGSALVPVYDFSRFLPGNSLVGPALIVSADTTILIDRNDVLNVDKYQNLIIELSAEVQ